MKRMSMPCILRVVYNNKKAIEQTIAK